VLRTNVVYPLPISTHLLAHEQPREPHVTKMQKKCTRTSPLPHTLTHTCCCFLMYSAPHTHSLAVQARWQ
jgi:hypothetical protein